MTVTRDPQGFTIDHRPARKPSSRRLSLNDFYAHAPSHRYLYTATGDYWPAVSLNNRIPPVSVQNSEGSVTKIKPSVWLDNHRSIESVTWWPGKPQLLVDCVVTEAGIVDRLGASCFNAYLPPVLELGDADKAGPWIELINRVYGDEAEHLIKWFASRVQAPDIKINHAVVLGGEQGVGKDSILAPILWACGPWNCQDITPLDLFRNFNGYARATILRVSEARDLGQSDRFKFYDHTKIYAATPPDMIRVNKKYEPECYAANCVGLVLTTNYKTDGLFLAPDDRRHFVTWSQRKHGDTSDKQWKELWRWYRRGGFGHVAAYLMAYDLSDFDPKTPPPQTQAYWDIINANQAPEDGELTDVLEALGNPAAVTIRRLVEKALETRSEAAEWLCDRRNRRAMPHRMERGGYVPVRNLEAEDGLWRVDDVRQVIYARASLTAEERQQAASKVASVKSVKNQ